MPDSPNERKARQRARERGELPPVPTCPCCGRAARGAHAPLCSRCWLQTTAGREWQRSRVQAWRTRSRNVA